VGELVDGVAGILSFNTNKIVTTNGGGAIVTDDDWTIACLPALSLSNSPIKR
jgi:dTDP-4-amino-4,6-dideoxygalactose transaminase